MKSVLLGNFYIYHLLLQEKNRTYKKMQKNLLELETEGPRDFLHFRIPVVTKREENMFSEKKTRFFDKHLLLKYRYVNTSIKGTIS